MRTTSPLALGVLVVFSLGLAGPAAANERHFTYTYESAVLAKDAKELEFWTTPRLGREGYFARFDNRLELEVGLTNRLQTSVYLNLKAVTQDTVDATTMAVARDSTLSFAGISSEWKYKFTDPVANAIGFALYGEVTGSTNEIELEAKLIFDKIIGKTLLAANIVGELEMELEPAETHKEWVLEVDLAAARFLTDHLAVGIELRNHNEIVGGEWEHSALFVGPVVAYATQSWWATVTIMPQIPALKKEGPGSLVLDEHEHFNARLILSFHL